MRASFSSTFWGGKKIFLTGHTGFKGSWLSLWLHSLGARVYGYSLMLDETERRRAFMLRSFMEQEEGDICDAEHVASAMKKCAPDLVIHLAAQPLVRTSYRFPVETFASNVMGTVCVLDAVRRTGGIRCALMVTTDKCYADQQWPWGYRETDTLGGHDPYSASKAAAELACASWRSSFLAEAGVRVMSARAGNVLGGWDYAKDRLIPDMVRAFSSGQAVRLRFPCAVRPWQHVLEPLGGYLHLLRLAFEAAGDGLELAEAWNFGPDETQVQTVAWMAECFARAWGRGARWMQDEDHVHPHETGVLLLDCAKARSRLGWRPALDAPQALAWTADWYKRALAGETPVMLCEEQIRAYTRLFED